MITGGLGTHAIITRGLGGITQVVAKKAAAVFRRARRRIVSSIASIEMDDEEILAIES